jgi:hypothetical protein
MGSAQGSDDSTQDAPNTAVGHIIIISSGVGISEQAGNGPAAGSGHVHAAAPTTAGLKIITEKEADTTRSRYRIAMNTVDPGCGSAAAGDEDAGDGEQPICWDGRGGRIVFLVALAELEGQVFGVAS